MKGVYDFIRFRFTQEVEDKDTKKKVWKEVFPQAITATHGRGYAFEFKVEAGTGSELFQPMFVFHDAVFDNPLTSQKEARAGITNDEDDSKLGPLACSNDYGKGSYNLADSICADLSNILWGDTKWRSFENDGKLAVYADSPVRITIYDFQAMRIVGQMYDKLIGCAVSRRISFIFFISISLNSHRCRIQFAVNFKKSKDGIQV